MTQRHPNCTGTGILPACYCPACSNMRHAKRQDELDRIQQISEGRVVKLQPRPVDPLPASLSDLLLNDVQLGQRRQRRGHVISTLLTILLATLVVFLIGHAAWSMVVDLIRNMGTVL